MEGKKKKAVRGGSWLVSARDRTEGGRVNDFIRAKENGHVTNGAVTETGGGRQGKLLTTGRAECVCACVYVSIVVECGVNERKGSGDCVGSARVNVSLSKAKAKAKGKGKKGAIMRRKADICNCIRRNNEPFVIDW